MAFSTIKKPHTTCQSKVKTFNHHYDYEWVGIVKFAWLDFAVLPTYIIETAVAAT